MTRAVVVRDLSLTRHAAKRQCGTAAYAQRAGIDTARFATALEPLLTPAIVGAEIARRCRDTGDRGELQVHELAGHALA